MANEKLAFTINEASAALGIGRSKLYGLISEGKLKPRKLGKRTLILAVELRQFSANLPFSKDGGKV